MQLLTKPYKIISVIDYTNTSRNNKKCGDINCTFLFTDLIKKCKTNTENTVMKYLPGPKHIKTSTITRYKNIQKAISTQFSCPVP